MNLAKSVGVHEALGEDGLGEEGVAQLNPLRLLPAPPSFTLFQTQEKEKGTNKGRAIPASSLGKEAIALYDDVSKPCLAGLKGGKAVASQEGLVASRGEGGDL